MTKRNAVIVVRRSDGIVQEAWDEVQECGVSTESYGAALFDSVRRHEGRLAVLSTRDDESIE